MNVPIIVLVLALVAMCATVSIGSFEFLSGFPQRPPLFINEDYYDTVEEPGYTFLSSAIVFQIIVPIGLYVSFEIVKLFQVSLIRSDLEMWDESADLGAGCRALNINEDLGQISFVFSDKTGTLTENIMALNAISVNGKVYASDPPAGETLTQLGTELDMEELQPLTVAQHLRDHLKSYSAEDSPEWLALECLALCNSVLPELLSEGQAVSDNGEWPVEPTVVKYHAESPDEAALVKAAREAGVELLSRSFNVTTLRLPDGSTADYEVLAVNNFTASRARMSVLVKRPNGTIALFCKGADTMVAERLASSQKNLLEVSLQHCNEFATEGNRTLLLAWRPMNPTETEEWLQKLYRPAQTLIVDRHNKLDDAAEQIEKNMLIIGGTSVEDKLQENVPATIQMLRDAGMVVWMLTGDKQETALNIALKCRLLSPEHEVVILSSDQSDVMASMMEARKTIQRRNPDAQYGVIIPGSFMHALTLPNSGSHAEALLWDIVKDATSVVCCRFSPLQKANVVAIAKRFTHNKLVLAIGDGANDVSMILNADVGVGISGKEGKHAVMASDFSLPAFRFLARLLLVHGHWNYYRNGTFVLYMLYKNAFFVFILFWYMIHNGFSGQSAIDSWNLIFVSFLYTSLPPIVAAVVDKDKSSATLLSEPALYRLGTTDKSYNNLLFFSIMGEMLFQSLVIFYFSFAVFFGSEEQGMWEFGVPQMAACVLVTNLQLLLMVQRVPWALFWAVLVSILLYVPVSLVVAINPIELTYGVMLHSLQTATFWLLLLLLTVTCLLPRFVVKAHRECLTPHTK
eukprot:c4394_g1_i1.p1 GENE.c4394_g1_i1~~c4394_g1_i1.p1  ORF type:complete len:800 (+),score=178.30 c4394_g1_i1:818-3217(+)